MKTERQVILIGILASQFTVQHAFQSIGPLVVVHPVSNKMMVRPAQRYHQQSLLFTSFIQEPPLSAEMDEEEEDHSSSLSSSSSSSSLETDDVLVRRDIEAMRQEAIQRLEALSEQMEIVKHDWEAARLRKKNELTAERLEHQHHQQQQQQPVEERLPEAAPNVVSLDCLEGDQTRQPMYSAMETTHSKSPSSSAQVRDEDEVDRYDLLEDTRWKIVFNIGREPGTWMPATWGQSGERVRFQVVVDFTDETYYQREDFFQGFATTTTAPAPVGSTILSSSVVGAKVLKVVQAFVIPTGVGSQSTGRIPIQVQPTGAYKVLKGQGPMGTDIVRLFIDLLQEVHRGDDKGSSDVYCPAGRVYATCGYFPMHPAKASDRHSWKDILKEEQHAILMRYEQLQMEMEQDDRLFSLDQIKRMKEMYQVKKQVTQVTQRLQEARQREPERSQLRLSLDGTVALSKEGGVCYKVHKGFAVEYHILGRMEVGCIDHDREEHDEYDELVHKLHP